MPHMSSGGSEDFFSTDEVKVYHHEGDEEKKSSEKQLLEEKESLVTETEVKSSSLAGNYSGNDKANSGRSEDDKAAAGPQAPGQNPQMGFFMPYASYANGASMGGKFGMPPYPGMMVINDFGSPPPAHMGIPPVSTDPKTGLPRPPVYAAYPAPPGQFPHHLYGPDFPQWHRPAGYPISSSAFSGSYPPLINTSSRFGPPGLLAHPGLPHPGIPHPAIIPPGGPKQEYPSQAMGQDNHRTGSANDREIHCSSNGMEKQEPEKKKPYIKKPLNAFMLFMKEMRAKVISECTLKESAAINQILGRKWHALDRSEQAKYYEMARKEKELHMQLYPGWSARDNYASHQKKKKRKREGSSEAARECTISKKCRARFGMEQQNQWCKPCRRKKKCIRFKRGDNGSGSDDDYDDDFCDGMATGESAPSGLDSDSNMDSPRPLTPSVMAATGDDSHQEPARPAASPRSPRPEGRANGVEMCVDAPSAPPPPLVVPSSVVPQSSVQVT